MPCLIAGWTCWLTVAADPLDLWHWRNPTPTGNRLFGVAANTERYVAVGEFGTILVSDDASSWRVVESGTGTSLQAVAWGSGLWVAVGDLGTILTSPDGFNWTARPTGFFYDLLGVTWGGGLFVAVGENTSILTSPDGAEWTLRATGTHPLRAAAWGNGTFVAVGGPEPVVTTTGGWSHLIPGEPMILSSPDGLSWTLTDAPVIGQVSCITHGLGRFVAATTSLQTVVSTDGIEWTPGCQPYLSELGFSAVACVGNRFVATYSSSSTIPGNFYASADGVTWDSERWTLETGPFDGRVVALAAGTHGVVGAFHGPTYSLDHGLIASADGRTWRCPSPKPLLTESERPVVAAGERFVVREEPGEDRSYQPRAETVYLISADGQKWDRTPVSDSEWFGLPAYGNGLWVAGGDHGQVAWSTNAVHWQTAATGQTTNRLLNTAFAGGMFLATGTDGTLLTSTDGKGWTRRALDATISLGQVAWSGGVFVVAESNTATVFTSADAISWSRHDLPANVASILEITAWEEGFLALAQTVDYGPKLLLRSTDAQTWTPETPPADSIARITVGGGRLLAFRDPGSRSFHARQVGETNWTTHLLPWVAAMDGVRYDAPASAVFGRGTFLLIHPAGLILQSGSLTNSAPQLTRSLAVVASAPDATVILQACALGSSPLRYQWRRDGTNLPSATWQSLSWPAGDVATAPITVVVENDFGSVESEPAIVTWATPARLELSPDLTTLRAWGTPGGRYRLWHTMDLRAPESWSVVSEFEVPSSGWPAHTRNLGIYGYWSDSQGFYRASAYP